MNKKIKTVLVGNIFGSKTRGSRDGDIFWAGGVCRTITSWQGGARSTWTLIEENDERN